MSVINTCKDILDLSPDMKIQIDKSLLDCDTKSQRGFVGMSKSTQQLENLPAVLSHFVPLSLKIVMEMALNGKRELLVLALHITPHP